LGSFTGLVSFITGMNRFITGVSLFMFAMTLFMTGVMRLVLARDALRAGVVEPAVWSDVGSSNPFA
jgi:hypothetical protein